jgi:hypothetical protein
MQRASDAILQQAFQVRVGIGRADAQVGFGHQWYMAMMSKIMKFVGAWHLNHRGS